MLPVEKIRFNLIWQKRRGLFIPKVHVLIVQLVSDHLSPLLIYALVNNYKLWTFRPCKKNKSHMALLYINVQPIATGSTGKKVDSVQLRRL